MTAWGSSSVRTPTTMFRSWPGSAGRGLAGTQRGGSRRSRPTAVRPGWTTGSWTSRDVADPGPGPEQLARYVGWRAAGEVEAAFWLRLGQCRGCRARCRARLPRLARGRTAAPAAVDQQPVDGVGHRVQGRADDGKTAERLPLVGVLELHLEGDAPGVGVPGGVERPVGQRSLDEIGAVRGLPLRGRELPVQNLDGPPLSHILR